MSWQNISRIAELVNSGEASATDNVQKALNLIKESKNHNAILADATERALNRAKEIDAQVAKGENAGCLAGVPFIAKDNYLTFGVDTTAASNILQGFDAPYQATVIEKLENQGAIMVAKANLDSFAHGGSTENSDFGPTMNPHDITRVPGGSSGGSAAAVALSLTPFALGSDTGGSIRQPANFTGTIGFKPTYGSVSRYGVVSMISSTDCMGPIANSTEDIALVYDVIAGIDSKDSTSIKRSSEDFTGLDEHKSLKIGLVKEHLGEGLDSGVKESVLDAVDQLKSFGHIVEEVSIAELELALACYYIIMPAEVSSNLAKFDGIRFGLSKREDGDLNEVFSNSRKLGFNAENKRRILIGNYVLSSGYYDAYYKKAQAVRTLLIRGFDRVFKKYDLLVGPVSPGVAFKLGENTTDPLKMYLEDVMTVPASLAGLPAISVPIKKAHNLPVGLQITGQRTSDKLVLELAKQLEGAQNG